MASSPNIRSLTSLRGFAAWWVVLFHFRGILLSWSGPETSHVFGCGYVAVDLFFVLSGFVIALNYGALFQNRGLAEAPYFLTVRLARIYPLHLFILCVMVITPLGLLLTGHAKLPARYDPGYFFLSLGLVQNWGFTNQIAWNDPAWSISTEWLAYILFPLFVWLFAAMNPSRGKLIAVIAALLLVLGAGARSVGGLGGDIAHFGVPRCLFEFLIGMSLYYLTTCTPRRQWISFLAFIVGIIAIGVFVSGIQPDYMVVPVGFLLIVYALSDQTMIISRVMSWRHFEMIGIISYSTYMVHILVDDWVKIILVRPSLPGWIAFPSAIILTCVLSVALYHVVEVPSRVWGRSIARRFVRLRPVGVR